MNTDRQNGEMSGKPCSAHGRGIMDKKDLELYVHIPFCIKKCAYCDFLSAPADAKERTSYVDALLSEIAGTGEIYKTHRVNTIFFGGGTPSVLDPGDAERIFHALSENFDISENAEITVEVNPGTVTKDKARTWKECGVTRLSIGLQSVNDDELSMLGRIHTYRDFLDTWETVRREGFQNVNIDLISAIPGQTVQSWETTLRTAAQLGPEHISAYSLIVEEGTPFYERYSQKAAGKNLPVFPPLPDEDTERRIYKATEKILSEYGYHRYEISNYAKDGYECRHNLGYWERKEYLGLGLGASSLIDERRFCNTADMEKYLRVCKDPDGSELHGEKERLSRRDQMEEFMFLGLRKTEGVSAEAFRENFGAEICEVYGAQIRRLSGQGLLELSEGQIRLTGRGIDISNYVFTEFLF